MDIDASDVIEVVEHDDGSSCSGSKKEISTSPTHPLLPTVIQPDGSVAESRRPSIIYPRPSSSRSFRDHSERKDRRRSKDNFRRSHETIINNHHGHHHHRHHHHRPHDIGKELSLRPHALGVPNYSPHRRLTLADALAPRSSKSNCSTPRRHSATGTDDSSRTDVQADIIFETLLNVGSRRNSLRVDDRLSRRSSRSSRSSRRRSSSSRRENSRKISTTSGVSAYDSSYHDGISRVYCHEEEEEEEDEEVVRKRVRIARIVGSVAAIIFLGAILLVALTLSLAPTIDEIGK